MDRVSWADREGGGILVVEKETKHACTFPLILRLARWGALSQRRRRRDLGADRANPGPKRRTRPPADPCGSGDLQRHRLRAARRHPVADVARFLPALADGLLALWALGRAGHLGEADRHRAGRIAPGTGPRSRALGRH